MNLRPLILLLLCLLMQAGQGLAWHETSVLREDGSSGAQACQTSCCEGLTAQQGCCCFTGGSDLPGKPAPLVPPSNEGKQAPQPEWVFLSVPFPVSAPQSLDGDLVHPGYRHGLSGASRVSLPVLHCAFLL